MLQWDFVFSLGYLPLHHKQLRKIFTFTFFNYTSQFHSAPFLDFGFTRFVISATGRKLLSSSAYFPVFCACTPAKFVPVQIPVHRDCMSVVYIYLR